jgi:hypothetical protein
MIKVAVAYYQFAYKSHCPKWSIKKAFQMHVKRGGEEERRRGRVRERLGVWWVRRHVERVQAA